MLYGRGWKIALDLIYIFAFTTKLYGYCLERERRSIYS
jgi:hypothetical protein